ncbi:MAG: hypothetical protein M3N46_03850 [Actinomycetota bacterium]|nr:hypothetical protein [Actinomycetota bacterium]
MSDSEPTRALAHRVDAAARAVEGVLRLYSATPIPARLARRIAHPDEEAPLAVVERHPGRLAVTVSLGVSALRAAPTTAGLVADAVRAGLHDQGPVDVHVRVSRVTED